MSSVAQIVRKIIDDLSDGVSELVLLVVVLAEQNAELPDQLPPASEIVNNTAKTLAHIARELAKTDYAEFPEIAKEINEASDAVDSATGTMGRAITVLQGHGDRKTGWNGLVDACRIMSGKTIRLLQIVYGADLKRLQLTADKLMDDIDGVNAHKNLNNPNNQKKFADDIGALTQKALKLANYVKDQAKDQESPFTRDLLNKVAQGLKDKAQDLIDAGNLALQNPELAPRVDDALRALKDEIKRAKDAVNDNQPEAPALKKLQNLMPLLDKAEKSVADLPKVVKNNPNGYERAEKAVKDDVGEVLKQIKPNPKLNRDAAKVEDNLKDAILAARKALKDPGNENQKELEKATNNLLDALNNLRKAGGPNKDLTPEQMKEFQDVLANLRKALNPDTFKKPEDKEQEAYERLKDNIDNLKKAVKNKDPEAPRLFKQTAQNAKDLAKQMQDNAKKLPPYERQRKDDSGKDIDNILPVLIKKGTPGVKNMNDEPAVEDLLDALRKLKRAADRGNKPKDERDMDENWRNLLNGLKNARDGADKGNKNDVDQGLKAIQDALANLRQIGDKMKERNPNPDAIEKPLRDLEQFADKFKNDAPKALSGDKGALQRMDKIIPDMQKSYDNLAKATGAKDIRPIHDVEDAIDNVVAAVDLQQPNRIAPAGKDLNEKMAELEKFLKSVPDEKARDFGNKVMEQLRPDFRDLLLKAKEAAQNPDKPGMADQVNDIADRMKHPLALLKKALHDVPSDRSPEAAGAAVKKALEGLRKALATGDPDQIRKAMNDLRDALGKYNDAAHKAAEAHPDPRKKHLLDKDADRIGELADDFKRISPADTFGIKKLMDEVPDRIDNWLDNLRGDTRDDTIKAAAKANNLLATLGNIGDDDMDLGDLLATAGELSDLMRGLVGGTADTARKLGTTEANLKPAALAALNLDNLLRSIEGGDTDASASLPNTATINLPAPTWTATSESHFEDIKLANAKTFDQVAAAIAREIHEQAKKISQSGDSLAMELANLARAARSGDRQALLLAAKAASAHILAFCKQINEVAQKMPARTQHEKREQDQMLKCAQALRNYGTQLKILASVKAASIEESRDTDESLSTLTRNLGEAVQAALKGMIGVKTMAHAH